MQIFRTQGIIGSDYAHTKIITIKACERHVCVLILSSYGYILTEQHTSKNFKCQQMGSIHLLYLYESQKGQETKASNAKSGEKSAWKNKSLEFEKMLGLKMAQLILKINKRWS
jgi:hypothetical protein